jgi:hypothetical protein
MIVVELGIPELTTEQIETLCSRAEETVRKYVLSKISNKDINRLDVSVEAYGAKPVDVTVEINLELSPQAEHTEVNIEVLVKDAVNEGHKTVENFLRNIK